MVRAGMCYCQQPAARIMWVRQQRRQVSYMQLLALLQVALVFLLRE